AVLAHLGERALIQRFLGLQRFDGGIVGARRAFDLAVKRRRLGAVDLDLAAPLDQLRFALGEAAGDFGLALGGEFRLLARLGLEAGDVARQRLGLLPALGGAVFHLGDAAGE